VAVFGEDRFWKISESEELFRTLLKRKYWKQIQPDILRRTISNAESDILRIRTFRKWKSVERVQRFVLISEQSHCLEQRFLHFGKGSENTNDAISNFANVLESLGSSAA
jgi:hypothetical protein